MISLRLLGILEASEVPERTLLVTHPLSPQLFNPIFYQLISEHIMSSYAAIP